MYSLFRTEPLMYFEFQLQVLKSCPPVSILIKLFQWGTKMLRHFYEMKDYLTKHTNRALSQRGWIVKHLVADLFHVMMTDGPDVSLFWTVDIPIPSPCVPHPYPQNQCCILDPQVFLLIETTLIREWGDLRRLKRMKKIIKKWNCWWKHAFQTSTHAL